PITVADCALRIALTGDWTLFLAEPNSGTSAKTTASVLVSDQNSKAAEVLRSDMRQAAGLLDALDENRLDFAWQPVRHGGAVSSVLYYEGLLRRFENGSTESASMAVESLERLGLAREVDRYAVNFIVGELFLDPTVCLGVNISAQSARLDSEWMEVLNLLA